jgi:hypothetical protein
LGSVYSRESRCDFIVQDFSLIYDYIIPHFNKYPLCNIKALDFEDFKEAAELFKEGGQINRAAINNIVIKIQSRR